MEEAGIRERARSSKRRKKLEENWCRHRMLMCCWTNAWGFCNYTAVQDVVCGLENIFLLPVYNYVRDKIAKVVDFISNISLFG